MSAQPSEFDCIDFQFVRREAGEVAYTSATRSLHRLVKLRLGDAIYPPMVEHACGLVLPVEEAKRFWFDVARERLRVFSAGKPLPSFFETASRLVGDRSPEQSGRVVSTTGLWAPQRLDAELPGWIEANVDPGEAEYGVLVIEVRPLLQCGGSNWKLAVLGKQLRRVLGCSAIYGHVSNGDVLIVSPHTGVALTGYAKALRRWLQSQVASGLRIEASTIQVTPRLTRVEQILRRRSGKIPTSAGLALPQTDKTGTER